MDKDIAEWVKANAPGGWIDDYRQKAAQADALLAALKPFADFAKMFEEAREYRQGHVPVEPNAEWYCRETKGGIYVLTPGMFDAAKAAFTKATNGK